MILNATTKRLEIVLGEAMATLDCDVTASWGDYAPAAFTPAGQSGASNGTTAVIVVPAPAANVQRMVQEVTLHNNDSIDHTVTLQLIDGAATRIVRRSLVTAGSDYAYSPTAGVPSADGSYFSVTSGTPDTLNLRAPAPDDFTITATGAMVVQCGGAINVGTDDATGATSTSALYSGNSATANSGDTLLYSGDAAAGSSGGVLITSGAAVGAGKASGDVTLGAGPASGGATKGHIVLAGLPTSAPATSGALWRDAGAANVIKVVP